MVAFICSTLPIEGLIVYARELETRYQHVSLETLKSQINDQEDTDNDGLSDTIERMLGTNIEEKDTDGDGLTDLFEVENNLNPLSIDTNQDGVNDLYEMTGGDDTLAITDELLDRDTDGDGITNLEDRDNDNDGVLDTIDLSPFSFVEDTDHYDMIVTTSGSATLVKIQIQPSDVEKMYKNNTLISWPQDQEGSIKNYNGEKGGIKTVPMLEITMDTYPDLATQKAYGYILDGDKLLIPLERMDQEGQFAALQGTLFIPKKSGKKEGKDLYKVSLSFKMKWSLIAQNDHLSDDFQQIGLVYYDGEVVRLEDITTNKYKMYLGSKLEDIDGNNLLDLIFYYTVNFRTNKGENKTWVKKEIYHDLVYHKKKGAFIAGWKEEKSVYTYSLGSAYKTNEGYFNLGTDAKGKEVVFTGKTSLAGSHIATLIDGDGGKLEIIGTYIPNLKEREIEIPHYGFYGESKRKLQTNLRDMFFDYDKNSDTMWYLYEIYNPSTKADELILIKNYPTARGYSSTTTTLLDDLPVDKNINEKLDYSFEGLEKGLSLDLYDIDSNGKDELILTDLSGKIYVIKDILEMPNNPMIPLPLKQKIERVHGQSIGFVDIEKDGSMDMTLLQAKRRDHKWKTDLSFNVSIRKNVERSNTIIMNDYDTFKITGIQIEEKKGTEIGVVYGEDVNQLLRMDIAFKHIFMNDNVAVQTSIEDYMAHVPEAKENTQVIYGKYNHYHEAVMAIGEVLAEKIPSYKTEKPVTILTKEVDRYLNLDDLSVLDFSKKHGEFDVHNRELVSIKRMTVQWMKNKKTLDQEAINAMVDTHMFSALGYETLASKELLAHFNFGLFKVVAIGDVPAELPTEVIFHVYSALRSPDSIISTVDKLFVSKPIQTIGNVGWKYESKLARYNTFTRYKSVGAGIGMAANVALAIHSGYMYGKAMAKAGGKTFGIISGITYGAIVFMSTFIYTILAGLGPIGWLIIAILVIDSVIAMFVDDYDGVVNKSISAVMTFFFDVRKYPGTYLHRMQVTDSDVTFRHMQGGQLMLGSEVDVFKEFLLSIRAASKKTPANKESILEESYANFYLKNISAQVKTENDKKRIYKEVEKRKGYWYEDKLYQFDNTLIFNQPGINLEVISSSKLETKLCDEVTYTAYMNHIFEDLEYSWDKNTTLESSSTYYDILPNSLTQLYPIITDIGLSYYDQDGDGLIEIDGKEVDGEGHVLMSSPYKYDTDGDGVDDYLELIQKTNPIESDSDGDGLTDQEELRLGTNGNKKDSDGDGLSDYREVTEVVSTTVTVNGKDIVIKSVTSPLKKDTDGDGLSDAEELVDNTNPTSKHTMGQLLYDGNKYAPSMKQPLEDLHDVLDGETITYKLSDYFQDLDGDKLSYWSNKGHIKEGVWTYIYHATDGKVVEVELIAKDNKDGEKIVNFIIEDTTGPYVKEVSVSSPTKIQSESITSFDKKIVADTVFEFQFNQPIQLKDGSKIQLRQHKRGELDVDLVGDPVSNALNITINKSKLIISRKAGFIENNIDYELYMEKGALKDLAGNQLEEAYAYKFTTVDTLEPILTSISETVALNEELILTFNEEIDIEAYTLHVEDQQHRTYDLLTERNDSHSMKVLVVSNLLDSYTQYQLSDTFRQGSGYAMKVKDLNGNKWQKPISELKGNVKTFTTGEVAGPIIQAPEVKIFGNRFYKIDTASNELVVEFDEPIYEGKYFDKIILSYDRSLPLFGDSRNKLLREEIKTFQLERRLRIEGNKLIITPDQALPILRDEHGEALSVDLSYALFIPQSALEDQLGNLIKDDWNENEYLVAKYGRDELYLKVYANKQDVSPPKLVTVVSPVDNNTTDNVRALITSYTANKVERPSKVIFAVFNKDVITVQNNHIDQVEIWHLDKKGNEIEKVRTRKYLPSQSFFGIGSYALMFELDTPLKPGDQYKLKMPEGLVRSVASFEEINQQVPNLPQLPSTGTTTHLVASVDGLIGLGGGVPSSGSGVPSGGGLPGGGHVPGGNLPGGNLPNLPEGMTLEDYNKCSVNAYQELIFTADYNLDNLNNGIAIDKTSFKGILRAGERIFASDKFEKYVTMMGDSLSYQWYRSPDEHAAHGVEIPNATSLVYRSTDQDVGNYLFLKLKVTYATIGVKDFMSPAMGPVQSALSNQNNLVKISVKVNDKEMIDFQQGKTAYTLSVPEEVETVSIGVEQSESLSGYMSSDDFDIDPSKIEMTNLPVEIGENTFAVESISEDFMNRTTYRITVIREGNFKLESQQIENDLEKAFNVPTGIELQVKSVETNRIVLQAKVMGDGKEILQTPIEWHVPEGFDYAFADEHKATLILFPSKTFKQKKITVTASVSGYPALTKKETLELKVKQNPKRFEDVGINQWFYEPINYLANKDMLEDIGDKRFEPNLAISRADFLVIAMRAFGIKLMANRNNFRDAGNTYYTKYLATAKKLGLVSGTGGNKFMPEKGITRQDACVMLYNILLEVEALPKYGHGDMEQFVDHSYISTYANEAMRLFVKTGLIQGSQGHLNPKKGTTRAEAAQIIYTIVGARN